MKKLFALLIALMMVFSLVACGNNEKPDPSNSDNPGTSQTDNQGGESTNNGGENAKEWNESNWQEYLAENFGLTNVANPGGTASVVKNYGGNITMIIFDDMPENFDYEEYVEQLWNACVGVAKDGTIYKQTTTKESSKGRYQECKSEVTTYSDVSRSVYGSDYAGYKWFYVWEGGYSDSENSDYFIKSINMFFSDSDNDDVDDQFAIQVDFLLSEIR